MSRNSPKTASGARSGARLVPEKKGYWHPGKAELTRRNTLGCPMVPDNLLFHYYARAVRPIKETTGSGTSGTRPVPVAHR